MSASEVIQAIESAFDGVERPDTSLRQFRLTDQKGLSEDISNEEWLNAGQSRIDHTWQEIPESEIEECEVVLAHMQAAEFRYYLPAYMRHAVNHLSDPVWRSDILSMTVSSLFPSRNHPDLYSYSVRQMSLLDQGQRQAVIQFLKFVAENADFVQRPDAQKALERYWLADDDKR